MFSASWVCCLLWWSDYSGLDTFVFWQKFIMFWNSFNLIIIFKFSLFWTVTIKNYHVGLLGRGKIFSPPSPFLFESWALGIIYVSQVDSFKKNLFYQAAKPIFAFSVLVLTASPFSQKNQNLNYILNYWLYHLSFFFEFTETQGKVHFLYESAFKKSLNDLVFSGVIFISCCFCCVFILSNTVKEKRERRQANKRLKNIRLKPPKSKRQYFHWVQNIS